MRKQIGNFNILISGPSAEPNSDYDIRDGEEMSLWSKRKLVELNGYISIRGERDSPSHFPGVEAPDWNSYMELAVTFNREKNSG